MKVRAYYFAPGSVTPAVVHVRVHTRMDAKVGDLKGTNLNYTEMEAFVPTLVFWRAECEPASKARVYISPEEGYRLNHTHDADGQTRKAEVIALSEADLITLAALIG